MPISNSRELFNLIKSLSKAEKRNFKLYAGRNHISGSLKFIELFDLLDRSATYDEENILQNLNGVSKSKLANLKRHLYAQILGSLRVITVSKKPNIEVRELIDFAYILYDKALYLQSIKILQKAKKEARKYHLYNLLQIVLEFEKRIESRHITRSGRERARQVIEESESLIDYISDSTLLSNLRIRLHARYIEYGHCQSNHEKLELEEFFTDHIQYIDEHALGLIEKIFLFQSYVWYHHILLDFDNCLKYSEKWLKLLEDNPSLIARDNDLYLRAFHYILSSCFHLRKKEKHDAVLERLENYRDTNYKGFSDISKIISFLYVHSARMNKIIMSGKYEEGQWVIPRTLRRIKKFGNKLDAHRILVFYFKIAWIYFGSKNYSKSIFYLNKIVNNDFPKLRIDLQVYSRILFLMCHYELGNYDIFSYSIKSFNTYFNKQNDMNPVREVMQDCFLKISKKNINEHHKILKDALQHLKSIQKTSFHKVSFTYLDVISWLEAKIAGKSLSSIIQLK